MHYKYIEEEDFDEEHEDFTDFGFSIEEMHRYLESHSVFRGAGEASYIIQT